MPLMASSDHKPGQQSKPDSCGKQQLFSSLPAFLQETMMQTGVEPDMTEAQMRSCAEHMANKPDSCTGK